MPPAEQPLICLYILNTALLRSGSLLGGGGQGKPPYVEFAE